MGEYDADFTRLIELTYLTSPSAYELLIPNTTPISMIAALPTSEVAKELRLCSKP